MIVDWRRFATDMEMEEAIVRELYAVFADELASDLRELLQAHACGDADVYASIVHKIKGTSSSYLAEDLHACISKADAHIKEGHPFAAMDMVPVIKEMGKAVLEEIASW